MPGSFRAAIGERLHMEALAGSRNCVARIAASSASKELGLSRTARRIADGLIDACRNQKTDVQQWDHVGLLLATFNTKHVIVK
jgi:hypothetical protein